MIIIGCDYHPGSQQITFVDTETGEFQEQRLAHREEAEKFYRELAARGVKARLGMEASGQARWFERLLAELKVELWLGDAAEIRAKRVRKKKTERFVCTGSTRSMKMYNGLQGIANGEVVPCEVHDLVSQEDRATVLVCDDALKQMRQHNSAFCISCAIRETHEFEVTFHSTKAEGVELKCTYGEPGFDCK
jgi:hypothetical protein